MKIKLENFRRKFASIARKNLICLKNRSGFFRGSLLIVFMAVFLFVAIFGGNYIKPKSVEAEPITLGVLITYFLVSALITGAGYLMYRNIKSALDVGKTVYNSSPPDVQEQIRENAEEGLTTGELDVKDETWQSIHEWAQENFPEGNRETDSVNLDVFNTGLLSPIESTQEYMPIFIFDLPINAVRTIDSQTYEYALEFGQDQLVLMDCTKVLDWRVYSTSGGTTYYWMYANGIRNNFLPYSGTRFTTIYFYEVGTDDQYFYYTGRGSCDCMTGTTPPKWILVADYDEYEKIYPAVVYKEPDGDCIMAPIFVDADGYYYGGKDFDYDIDEDKPIDVVVWGNNIDDEYYDIDNEGHRYLEMPMNIDQIINKSVDEILNGEYASTDVIAGAITVQTEEFTDYYDQFLVYMAKLEHLDSLTYDETGALRVTMEGSQSSQYELDIPETEFDMPTIALLADKFPFSIPFDLYNAIANLEAEPEAPEFNINVPASIMGGVDFDMDLDFSQFENVAKVIRWTILVGFLIGLIIVTRKLIRG